MVSSFLLFAVCFSPVTSLRMSISSSSKFSQNKIPNIVWVTGEWDSDSNALNKIEGNIHLKLGVVKRERKESLDWQAFQKFGKWTPLGSQIRYFSDENMDESVRNISAMLDAQGIKNVDKAYSNLRPGAYRADLWRLMMLWAEGGVYLDANIKLKRKLEDWIDYANDELVLVEDKGAKVSPAYWNAMMAAAPRNQYLENAIKDVVSNIHGHYYGHDALSITGPMALGTSLKSQPNFPTNIRLELQWKHGKCYQQDETFATKDEELHFQEDPTRHYGPMWKHHQVYCDEKGPKVDRGKCAAK